MKFEEYKQINFKNEVAVLMDNVKADDKPKPYPIKQAAEIKTVFDDRPLTEVEKLFQEDSLAFIAPGLQKNVLKKLRKGFFGSKGRCHTLGSSSYYFPPKYPLLYFQIGR